MQGNELLLAIPEAQLQIYSKYILLLFEISPRGKSITMETIPTMQGSNHQPSNIISLMSSQLVFEIIEVSLNVRIVNIKTNSQVLVFHVNTHSTLINVQSLLRTKLCELGFQRTFSFIKKLGQGASADVHLIERVSDGKLFAVKIISLKTTNQKLFQTFLNEIKLLRCLNHRHIIHLQSVYYSKKHFYQVLEYLEGGTLYQQISNSVIRSTKDRWRVIYHLTLAVEYLRQKMIVHRDIKMQNVMVRINSNGKKDYVLADFGLSSWIGQKKPLYQRCGTPGYIAPQILNVPKGFLVLNHKIDVFSLGVIYHLLLVGKSLFKFQGSIKQLLEKNKNFKSEQLNQISYSLCYTDYKLLQKSLNSNPQQRATTAELLQKYIFPESIVQHVIKQQYKKKKQVNIEKLSLNKLSVNKSIQVRDVKSKLACKSLSKRLNKLTDSIKKPDQEIKNRKEQKGFLSKIFSFCQKNTPRKKDQSTRKYQIDQFNKQ